MPKPDFDAITEEIRKQLDSTKQNWLFGAGISYNANIPLMYPLTDRVKNILSDTAGKDIEIYNLLTEELDEKAHIEHYLSHLGDLIAIADRSRNKSAIVNKQVFCKDQLLSLYRSIISAIGKTVRYGYCNKGTNEEIGSPDKPIVEIKDHINFVQAIYSNSANLLPRSKLAFFTTNYDTLLEDALALEKFTVIDGFSGGSVAYWNPIHEFADSNNRPNKCIVYKLHGSVDWHKDEITGLVRTRYGTKYLAEMSDIMIFPQSTKYVETQKDPFSYLFSGFRNALNSTEDNILITCGYSFGDAHINAEIEAALNSKNNRTTLIAFSEEVNGSALHETLTNWLNNTQFGNRIYVAGKKGVYYHSTNPIPPPDGKDLYWWTFNGLTKFISTGEYE